MARNNDLEDDDSQPQASSSKSKITNDSKNPFADFEFDKLPTELLVEIFRHARADSLYDAHNEKQPYPVALSQVCRHWRTVAIDAPTLWTDIRVLGYHTEAAKRTTRIYLERSKTCPIFLTWFTEEEFRTDVTAVVERLITPAAERWQRITLIAGTEVAPEALLTAMESLDFPILRDIEISRVPWMEPFSSTPTLCRSAPLLRRCRFRDIFSPPSLPSNLVVLDCTFLALGSTEFDLDPFLEFLPHVAHSLEHLRFGPPLSSRVHFTPGTPKIPLENLNSFHIIHSHVIVDHILAPNLTYFVASHSPGADAKEVAEMFQGFSAPKLRSIQFHKTPLLPFLATHSLPSMFPQLESVLLSGCVDESAFVPLLENTFPHLKELTISDMTIWTSLQAAIEKRLKNGKKPLRKIQLPKGDATETIMPHLRRWLPAQGIKLVLYEPGELPRSTPEFQDESCDEEDHLFFETTMRGIGLGEDDEYGDDYGEFYGEDYDEDDHYDFWEEGVMPYPAYELPSYADPHQHWDRFYVNDEEGYGGEFRGG